MSMGPFSLDMAWASSNYVTNKCWTTYDLVLRLRLTIFFAFFGMMILAERPHLLPSRKHYYRRRRHPLHQIIWMTMITVVSGQDFDIIEHIYCLDE